MKNRSYDREELVEPSEAPDPSGSGTFVEGSDAGSPPDLGTRTLLHDTRNWLAVALAHLELARRHGDPDRHLERARQALESAHSRLDTPEGHVSPRAGCEARSVARACLGHVGARWRRAWVETGSADEVPVALPREVLANLLLNLLQNAAHATAEGGRIEIRAEFASDRVHLSVGDDGEGMDAQTLRHCLLPGHSGRPGRGEGLGLAQVAAAVRRFGGEISVESAPGEGCRVSLDLPRASTTPSRAETPTGGEAPRASGQRRVLLVEDDLAVAEALAEMIVALGATARTAASAREAESVLAETQGGFELILVDQGLPDTPGIELASRLRAAHSDLTIVLLTGDPRAASFAAGSNTFDQVATKPLGLEALRALLHSAPRGPRSRRRQDEARG